jgi:hypothetical protein
MIVHVGRSFRRRRPRDPWTDAAERVERVMRESGLPLDEVLVGSDLDSVDRLILAFGSWDTERPNWHKSIGDHVAPTLRCAGDDIESGIKDCKIALAELGFEPVTADTAAGLRLADRLIYLAEELDARAGNIVEE